MHILTIACAPIILQFVYKTKEAAETAWDTKSDEAGRINIADDFGQRGSFKAEHVSCYVIEDCDLSKQAHIDRSLMRDRTQASYQKAAESDPVLRMSMRGGPAMIQPMFNGRGN